MNPLTPKFEVQDTPNPFARKYIFDFEVKLGTRLSFKAREECDHVPLAAALFDTAMVRQLHFFQNILTITILVPENPSEEQQQDLWGAAAQKLGPVLDRYLPVHDPAFLDPKEIHKQKLSPELQLIDGVLDREIRHYLQADGGDVQVLEYEKDVLTIKYEGACGGCPSAEAGTLEAIVQILRREVNPKIQVVTIE
jgi:Fe-S cluster biogenesis protein NfuA